MDVHEDAAANTVTASFELPGLAKEDVDIDVHNNVLTVSGETKQSSERDENDWVVRERRFGKFARSIPLPEGVKASISDFAYVHEPMTDNENYRLRKSRQASRTACST